MTRFFTNSLAALATIVLATASIGTIVTVPPANAPAGDTPIFTTEIA